MGSTVHSGEGDSAAGTVHHEQHQDTSRERNSGSKQGQSHHRVVFFRRKASDDSDASLHSFDGSPSETPPEKCTESELLSRVSRLSSGVSFGSNNTDGLPNVLVEGEHEDETERDDDRGLVGFGNLDTAKLEVSEAPPILADTPEHHTLGHRHELPLSIPEKAPVPPENVNNNPKKGRQQRQQQKPSTGCIIQ
jgi:hypothetical protein